MNPSGFTAGGSVPTELKRLHSDSSAEKQFSRSGSAEGIGPPIGSAPQGAEYFKRSSDDSCRANAVTERARMTKKGASDAEEWSNEVKAKPNELRGPKLKPSPLKLN